MPAAEAPAPVSAEEADRLFYLLAELPALVIAVSGGPDSTALMVLLARWRKALARGPKLVAATVDHGLRPEARREAQAVKRLARTLGLEHRTLRWTGPKPETGLQEAARLARYRLLAAAAMRIKARHILTAHTLDDQAETVLFRLARGSGISGLGGMMRVAPLPLSETGASPISASGSPPPAGGSPLPACGERSDRGAIRVRGHAPRAVPSQISPRPDPLPAGGERVLSVAASGLLLLRPFLDIPKARLVATLEAAHIPYADDPSNREMRFARSRLRMLMPALAREGLTAARLALLAQRAERVEDALFAAVNEAQMRLAGPWRDKGPVTMKVEAFAELPQELRLRLLARAIAWVGHEGPAELGKLEALEAAMSEPLSDAMMGHTEFARFRRTLAGAVITLARGRLCVAAAPPRRATKRDVATGPRRNR